MMIIKIGGGAAINLEGIAEDLSRLEEPFIIVHGANALRDSLAEQLQVPKKTVTSVSGYTSVFSDRDIIDLQMMAYAGLRNKRIVELFQQRGINAVGLSGLDGGVIRGKRNAGIRVREGGKLKLLRDFSGKPKEINKALLDVLLGNGYTPVLTVPIIDESNVAINSENDDIVVLLQEVYGAERVLHLIEAAGLLEDSSDPGSVISELSVGELVKREKKAEGRIKRKLLAIKHLFEKGAEEVMIADGRSEQPVMEALNGRGTIIKSFSGVQGAVFQKSPLAAGASMLLDPICTAREISDATS
ncbi:MAG: [LysW]-aminoadipate kinase [bacterium]|nr:[LysW]-aminoadipate kinase [bacterium]